MNRTFFALGGAAVVIVVVAALALNLYVNEQGIGGPPTPSPSPSTGPTAGPPTPSPSPSTGPTGTLYTSSDGEVTVSAPSSWEAWLPGKLGDGLAPDVWFGMLLRATEPVIEPYGSGNIGLVDPVAYDAWCAANGGSPLLTAPADAAAIAQQLIADPNFETTAPVAARVGGVEALSIDVALAAGGRTCGVGMIVISRWIHGLVPGIRLRLYLVDLPEGMAVDTLAVTVQADEDRFEEVIAETAPIIESIEFHVP